MPWSVLLLLLVLCPLCLGLDDIITLSNDQVAFTIDLNHGCSVSGAWSVGDPSQTNVINTHDFGRYVQASYYSGPTGYHGCVWMGNNWPWNPISAGDVAGNPAVVQSSSNTTTTATCMTRPMQWACDNVACDCLVELSYRLEGSALLATYTLHNQREDTTDYNAYDQEIPAAYVNGFLDTLYGYVGNSPCEGNLHDLTTLHMFDSGWDTHAPDPWVPGNIATLTEPWMAFVRDDGNKFGLGVWRGGPREGNSDNDENAYGDDAPAHPFKAGFFGEKGSGGTKDPPTGYIAPRDNTVLHYNSTYTYDFALILGNLGDIRQQACRFSSGEHTEAQHVRESSA